MLNYEGASKHLREYQKHPEGKGVSKHHVKGFFENTEGRCSLTLMVFSVHKHPNEGYNVTSHFFYNVPPFIIS